MLMRFSKPLKSRIVVKKNLRCYTVRADSQPRPMIIYTKTDEAPLLATASFFPILSSFCRKAEIIVSLSNISLANRILSLWSHRLKPEQRVEDDLAKLGQLVRTPFANIIKLPNISASIPQLISCIKELQKRGYYIPDYPSSPSDEKETTIQKTYSRVLGSAVNPVLREGNSLRWAAAPVKQYAMKHPTRLGDWSPDSKTHVAHMTSGDFFENEISHIMQYDDFARIEFREENGNKVKVMKDGIKLLKGEVIDSTFMSRSKLESFLDKTLEDARKNNLLFSVHLKATMMKVSDPKIFGAVVLAYFKPLFAKHAALFDQLGVDITNGFDDVIQKIQALPLEQRAEIERDIEACYARGPPLAVVRENRTNLHVPSDVIVDASMPAVIRDSGKMWNSSGQLQDTVCVIPDRCYALQYQSCIDFMKNNGRMDAGTMGHTSNIGLMAQKAEEYGSHDKTFEAPSSGEFCVVDSKGAVLLRHAVERGDLWRMCQTKELPIRDWVQLAVTQSRATNTPAIFWLDEHRAHDRNLIGLVKQYLKEHNIKGLAISIMPPHAAMVETLKRAKAGKDTITVTGNVLRDYNTDLFPILELGTSAKMLSVVPLLAGGKLYETGAGGSAPKHVEQFLKEGHLRWDSLGEYLAVAASLQDLGKKFGSSKAAVLGGALNEAVSQLLDNQKLPSRKVHELDNRGSTFYLTWYWARSLATRNASFNTLASQLEANAEQILKELNDCQGRPVDLGGYYFPHPRNVAEAMRPSELFNSIIDQ
jgi:isocitrate dehydrogenase